MARLHSNPDQVLKIAVMPARSSGQGPTKKPWFREEPGLSGVGAGEESRTPDLRITNALLYQLSYTGADKN
jgi:hypothetical protein